MMKTTLFASDPIFSRDNSISKESEDSSLNTPTDSALDCPVCRLNQSASHFTCLHVTSRSSIAKTCDELLKKLHTTLHLVSMENVILQSENEALRKAFNSKCEAVDILKVSTCKSFDVDQTCWNAFHENLALKSEIAQVRAEMAILQGSLAADRNAYEARVKCLCESNKQLKEQLEKMQARMEHSVGESSRLTGKYQNIADESNRFGFSNQRPIKIVDPTSQKVSGQSKCQSSPVSNGRIMSCSRPTTISATVATGYRNHEKLFSTPSHTSTVSDPNLLSSHSVTASETSCPSLLVDQNSLLSRIDAKYTHCSCLPAEQKLCDCALASIIVQRSLLNCSHQLSTKKRRVRDLKITIKAYKIALESEFGRNQALVKAFSSTLANVEADVTSVTNKSVVYSGPALFPGKQVSNPSVALNELLLWFCHTLRQLTQRLQKMATSSWSAKSTNDNDFLHPPPIKSVSAPHPRVSPPNQTRPRARHSLDSLFVPDIVPKPPTRLVRRPTARGSQRQIERLRETRPVVDVNFWSDATSTPDSSSSSGTVSPNRNPPKRKVNRWVYNYGDGARLLARVRSMDLSTCNADDCTSFDQQSNLELLSHLLVKLNELHELVTKQQLVWKLSTDKKTT